MVGRVTPTILAMDMSVRGRLCSQFATLKGYFYTNLVGTLALKGDWKLPVKRKPSHQPKSQPPPQEPPSEISDEEWAKQREKARATFNDLKDQCSPGREKMHQDETEGLLCSWRKIR
jgi:hypothetical protein